MKIHPENWQFARLNRDDLLAFIAFGASLSSESDHNPSYEYTVLLTDVDYKEIYSKRFNELELALNELDKRYGSWDILAAKNSKDGCDSCSAH